MREHVEVEVLGAYTAGEKPERWRHIFADAAGQVIPLTGGWQAKLAYRVDEGAQVLRNAVIVGGGSTGEAEYAWAEVDTATAGHLQGNLWVGNGVNRYAAAFSMTVEPAAGGPAPPI